MINKEKKEKPKEDRLLKLRLIMLNFAKAKRDNKQKKVNISGHQYRRPKEECSC